MNITLLLAMTVFAWSSVALGFKASNLTNRGIVSRGPYAFVRHPAYAAKNLAWWIGAVPGLIGALRAGRRVMSATGVPLMRASSTFAVAAA